MRLKYLACMLFTWSAALGNAQDQQAAIDPSGTKTKIVVPALLCSEKLFTAKDDSGRSVQNKITNRMINDFYKQWIKELPSSVGAPTSAKSLAVVMVKILANGSVESVTLIGSSGPTEIIEADQHALRDAKFHAFPKKLKTRFITIRILLFTNSKCSDYDSLLTINSERP